MRRVSHRQNVDNSPSSSLAVCTCGWRQLAGSAPTAWAAARNHALNSHRGEQCNALRSRYAK